MRKQIVTLGLAVAIGAAAVAVADEAAAYDGNSRGNWHGRSEVNVQLGPRPFFLINDMADSPLKRKLQQCSAAERYQPSNFSIGHRGAPLQFPEHTREVL